MIDGNKILADRKQKEWSQQRLAREANLKSYQLIGQIERGENLTSKLIYRIAAALGKPASHYDPEISDIGPLMVQVVGYVGAGGEANFADGQGTDDYVEAPPGTDESCAAVEIRGVSMGIMFDRWLAFYNDRRDPPDESFLRQICIVGLKDGRVMLKQIMPSAMLGRFTLKSVNQHDIEDVELEWAAKVKAFAQR